MNRYLSIASVFLLFGSRLACEHDHRDHDHHHDAEADQNDVWQNDVWQNHFDHHHDSPTGNHLRATTPKMTAQRQLEATTDALATEECGFVEPTNDEIKADQSRMRSWRIKRADTQADAQFDYSMPVYAHVIQPSADQDIVPDSNVQTYMTYLNNAFSGISPFTFYLVEITRTVNSVWSNDCRNSTNEVAYKSILKRGGKESLNIYLCNLVPNGPGKALLAGFTYSPSQNVGVKDGIVLARTNPNDLRRPNTLVHETVRCKVPHACLKIQHSLMNASFLSQGTLFGVAAHVCGEL